MILVQNVVFVSSDHISRNSKLISPLIDEGSKVRLFHHRTRYLSPVNPPISSGKEFNWLLFKNSATTVLGRFPIPVEREDIIF